MLESIRRCEQVEHHILIAPIPMTSRITPTRRTRDRSDNTSTKRVHTPAPHRRNGIGGLKTGHALLFLIVVGLSSESELDSDNWWSGIESRVTTIPSQRILAVHL